MVFGCQGLGEDVGLRCREQPLDYLIAHASGPRDRYRQGTSMHGEASDLQVLV